MSGSSTATPIAASASKILRRSDETTGMLLGLAGVAIFSLTLPFTRLAVAELSPLFATMGRAVVAALLAGLWLWWQRAPLPGRSALPGLAIVAAGCVIGFPLLTSIAMRTLPASHGAVLVGILPLATALFAALRGHERPSAGFWCAALAGSGLVVGFALSQSGGTLHLADVLMLGAVLAAALGYAEGGRLSQALGGQQVISWALLLSLPVALPLPAGTCGGMAARWAPSGPRLGAALPIPACSRCSSASSSGTAAWRKAAWPASARSSCCNLS